MNKCSLSDFDSTATCETKTIPLACRQPTPLFVASSVLPLAVRNNSSVNAIKGTCVSALLGVQGAGLEMELPGHRSQCLTIHSMDVSYPVALRKAAHMDIHIQMAADG